jgi:imidazoleglycerol-phosphate dehydratase
MSPARRSPAARRATPHRGGGTGRRARGARRSKETTIALTLVLDGKGRADVRTGLPFFDHMLTAFAHHALFDLKLRARGDLHVDAHHTVEDTGLVLGRAFREAVGERRGIARYGASALPMDETLALVAVDVSGRPFVVWETPRLAKWVGTFPAELAEDFWRAFAQEARITLHVRLLSGRNTHHMLEAIFKGAARALYEAVAVDPRRAQAVPSTKGKLD